MVIDGRWNGLADVENTLGKTCGIEEPGWIFTSSRIFRSYTLVLLSRGILQSHQKHHPQQFDDNTRSSSQSSYWCCISSSLVLEVVEGNFDR